ncbi:hypothetical protein KKF82_05550 [Patescibacteria group bacterium]|nr:hypothetical protein [Patescibacteria group bacterium]
MKAYFVSNFGDISIEQKGNDVEVVTKDLTVHEEKVLNEVIVSYYGLTFDVLDNQTFSLKNVKISDIHKKMKKALKKEKPTLTAIKLKDGTLELINELTEEDSKKATDSVTVDKPKRGCPMSEVTRRKEINAQIVLEKFLSTQQLTDFENRRSFISNGNWSNNPYMITSRWSDLVVKYGQVYDIVNKSKVCTSCSYIPPAEEMLSMKLSIELNEKNFLETPEGMF